MLTFTERWLNFVFWSHNMCVMRILFLINPLKCSKNMWCNSCPYFVAKIDESATCRTIGFTSMKSRPDVIFHVFTQRDFHPSRLMFLLPSLPWNNNTGNVIGHTRITSQLLSKVTSIQYTRQVIYTIWNLLCRSVGWYGIVSGVFI